MQDFKYDFKYKNKTIEFFSTTGEVLDSTKRDETRVHSVGGGGYVGRHGGYVRPAQTYSTTVTHQDIWLKTKDGEQAAIQLVGHDVPMLPGQQISVVTVGLKGGDSRYYSLVVNHSAGTRYIVNGGAELNKFLGITRVVPDTESGTVLKRLIAVTIQLSIPLVLIFLWWVTGALLMSVLEIFFQHDVAYSWAWLLPPIIFMFFFIKRYLKIKKMEADLDTHLDRISVEIDKLTKSSRQQ